MSVTGLGMACDSASAITGAARHRTKDNFASFFIGTNLLPSLRRDDRWNAVPLAGKAYDWP
jgi:hypothetical protein